MEKLGNGVFLSSEGERLLSHWWYIPHDGRRQSESSSNVRKSHSIRINLPCTVLHWRVHKNPFILELSAWDASRRLLSFCLFLLLSISQNGMLDAKTRGGNKISSQPIKATRFSISRNSKKPSSNQCFSIPLRGERERKVIKLFLFPPIPFSASTCVSFVGTHEKGKKKKKQQHATQLGRVACVFWFGGENKTVTGRGENVARKFLLFSSASFSAGWHQK